MSLSRLDIPFVLYRFEWFHPSMLDDEPRLEAQGRYVVDLLVRESAGWQPPHVVDPATVETRALSPADLVETITWLNDQRARVTIDGVEQVMGDPLPVPTVEMGAMIAYVPAEPVVLTHDGLGPDSTDMPEREDGGEYEGPTGG